MVSKPICGGCCATIMQEVKTMIIFGCYILIVFAVVVPDAILVLGGKAYGDGILAVPPILNIHASTLGTTINETLQSIEY